MKRIFLISSLLVGCGGAYPGRTAGPEDEPEGSVEDYAARIERMQHELQAELAIEPSTEPEQAQEQESSPQLDQLTAAPAPGGLDCSAAADLRDRICELAARICRLAERSPGDANLAATCEKAGKTCDEARAEVSRRCD